MDEQHRLAKRNVRGYHGNDAAYMHINRDGICTENIEG